MLPCVGLDLFHIMISEVGSNDVRRGMFHPCNLVLHFQSQNKIQCNASCRDELSCCLKVRAKVVPTASLNYTYGH